uniref:Uncharacterized protein n=1 Tax=Hyaloperonospora arabidopsidis (strain Emoy2) TaxID=559515 RepID=M4BB83_HYAAE
MNLSVLQCVADWMGGEYRLVWDSNALRTEFNRIVAVLCAEASLALCRSQKLMARDCRKRMMDVSG